MSGQTHSPVGAWAGITYQLSQCCVHWCLCPGRPPGSPICTGSVESSLSSHTVHQESGRKCRLPSFFCTEVCLHFACAFQFSHPSWFPGSTFAFFSKELYSSVQSQNLGKADLLLLTALSSDHLNFLGTKDFKQNI